MDEFYDEFIEKTDYLTETKGLLKDRINSLGGSITSGTTFRDYLVWLDSLYEALEEKTITGLPDSLEGKCEQTTTQTGKNLLKLKRDNETGGSYDSATDKYTSTTRTGTAVWYFKTLATSLSYTFSTQSTTNAEYLYCFSNSDLSAGSDIVSLTYGSGGNITNGNRTVYNNSNLKYLYVTFRTIGSSVEGKLEKPMLEVGETATSYEPYIPNSPSPDYPQPINITTGEQEVFTAQKNLADVSKTLIGYAWNWATNSGRAVLYIPAKQNTDYTFSYTGNSVDGVYATFKTNKSDTTYLGGLYTISGSRTITSPANTNWIIVQFAKTSISIDDITPLKLMVSTSSDTTYEEYKGNDYEINLGKNLFDDSTLNNQWIGQNGSISTASGSNCIRFECSAGETYSLTATYGEVAGTYEIIVMAFYNSSGTLLQRQAIGFQTTLTLTKTAPANTAYMYAGHYSKKPDTIQLEKGQPTSYSPYKTPIYLGKIGNYQDYIFRNTTENPLYDSNLEEGQWYIHKEIGKITFTGANSENWQTWGVNFQTQGITGFYTYIFNDYNYNGRNLIISNYFANDNAAWGGGKQGINASSSGTKYGIISIENTNLSDISSSTNAINSFKTWLGTHNVEVFYVLATPTNTLIEDEELINQLNEIEIFTVISEDFYN